MKAPKSQNVVVFGATGTIGQATVRALRSDGHTVATVVRSGRDGDVQADVAEYGQLDLSGYDTVVSCLASRTGAPDDAWRIDHDAHQDILAATFKGGVQHFVLLSALCVQKPKLAFQRAKLAFEGTLQASGLTYSIVRPTAFFKSLSGQVRRVQEGKPFLIFGDGQGTACKPISDHDLGRYLSLCLTDTRLHNKVLPIGGPGAPISPRAQGEMLFDLLGLEPNFRSVPIWVMDGIIGSLRIGGSVSARLRAKAELARIGRYYATESMLVWDGVRYDAAATPSFGCDTLQEHYRAMITGETTVDLGDHAVF
ncbi:MAG: NAD(P)H-binding protein [Pseudomonadota bacterium]